MNYTRPAHFGSLAACISLPMFFRSVPMGLLIVVLCLPMSVTSGQEIPVVVPFDLEEEEGNAAAPNFTDPFRAVGIWFAEDFPSIPQSHRWITGLPFVPMLLVSKDQDPRWEDVTWRLSTTEEDELSRTLSDNLDPNVTQTVFEGTLEYTLSSEQGEGPRAFDYRVDFQRLFEYHPNDGRHLVWEIVAPNGYNPPLLDDQHDFGDGTVFSVGTLNPEGDTAEFSINSTLITLFTFVPTGDFDASGILDAGDIDLLSAEVRAETNNPAFDLNDDGLVNDEDRVQWVKDLANTYFGDANLDGEFNSGDLVSTFSAGKYEIDTDAGWADGDWGGDMRFDSGDFVVAFEDGGYEQGPPVLQNAVPEPTTNMWLAAFLVGVSLRRRLSSRCC